MRIASVGEAFPDHYYDQATITGALKRIFAADRPVTSRLDVLHENVMVAGRHLSMPIGDYEQSLTFGRTNQVWIDTAVQIGAAAIHDALAPLGLEPADVDAIFTSTVTGVTSPTLDARLVNRLGLRPDIKRTPMFGLGCVAGAAATARAVDYVRAYPDQIALVLTVELCSLTFQANDRSVANLIATGLFGDGAAAAVVAGASSGLSTGPEVLATRSVFYPDTEEVMGWEVSERGFRVILSPQVPAVARELLPRDVDAFLGDHGMTRDDIGSWVCHPGGPKVLGALQEGLGLTEADLRLSHQTLLDTGNISSVSVLLVLRELMRESTPRPGSSSLMLAMGPGFCSELLLLRW